MFIAACCKRKTRLEQPKYLSIGYWLYKWRVPHFCWEIQFSSLRACSLCGYRQGFHTAQQQRRIYGAVCVVWSYLGANWCISVLYIRMGVLLAVLDSRVVGLWGVLLSLCSWNIFVTIMCDQNKINTDNFTFFKKGVYWEEMYKNRNSGSPEREGCCLLFTLWYFPHFLSLRMRNFYH